MTREAVQCAFETLDRLIEQAEPERLPALQSALAARIVTVAARQMEAPTPGAKSSDGPDENLGIQEAARRLGVSVAYLYKHAKTLPFSIQIGRRRVFSVRGIERYKRLHQGR